MKHKGTCKHFTGISVPGKPHELAKCELGICYRTLVGGEYLGWATRIPCITEKRAGGSWSPQNGERVVCDKYEEPTDEEIAKDEAEWQATFKRITSTLPLVAEIKKQHNGKNAGGSLVCPCCGQRLDFRHSGYNGHVHMHCVTPGCVSFME